MNDANYAIELLKSTAPKLLAMAQRVAINSIEYAEAEAHANYIDQSPMGRARHGAALNTMDRVDEQNRADAPRLAVAILLLGRALAREADQARWWCAAPEPFPEEISRSQNAGNAAAHLESFTWLRDELAKLEPAR